MFFNIRSGFKWKKKVKCFNIFEICKDIWGFVEGFGVGWRKCFVSAEVNLYFYFERKCGIWMYREGWDERVRVVICVFVVCVFEV